MTTFKREIERGVAWSIFLAIGRQGLTLLSTMVLAHLLSPDEYGLIGMIAIFIALSETLMDAGMGGALIKKRNATKYDYGTLSSYNLIVSLFLYIVIFLSATTVASFYNRPILVPVLRLYALVFLVEAAGLAARVKMLRELQFKTFSLINVAANLVGLIVATILALLKFGVYCLVWQLLASSIVFTLCIIVISHYKFYFCFRRQSFYDLFGFGFNTTFGNMIKGISENVITNIVAKVCPLKETGYYNQSFKMQNVVASMQNIIIDNALFPILSKESDDDIHKHSIVLNTIASFCVTILYLLLILNAKLEVTILLGEQWMEMLSILPLLYVVGLLQSLTAFYRNTFKALAETRFIVYIEALSSCVLFFLFYTSLLGIYAIIYTFILYAIVRWQLCLCFLSKNGHYKTNLLSIMKSISLPILSYLLISTFVISGNEIIDSLIKSVLFIFSIIIGGEIFKNSTYLILKKLLLKKIKV
jgi:O-antigen/teichoic acid export membrane protein